MILSSKYPQLIRFIFSNLRHVEEIPFQDGFILAKDLINTDLRRIEHFQNYVVISTYFAEKEWARQDIVDYVITKTHSRRKPKFDWMNDAEFIDAVKVLYVAGLWPELDQNAMVFELFQNIDSHKRLEIYFQLRESLSPYEIFYSVLTFVRRCYDDNVKYEVSPGYLRVIDGKRTLVKKNFSRSIREFAKQGDIDQDFKTLSFINSIGDLG